MRKTLLLSALLSSQFLLAQTSPQQSFPVDSIKSEMQRRLDQSRLERWAADPNFTSGQQAARRNADIRVREFYQKATHFVELWHAFANELNDQQTFNAKLAKQVSKAFHDLEKSDGWPIRENKNK